jgi:two-component system cell cycle sensor histidine kinase/response regulator CckA
MDNEQASHADLIAHMGALGDILNQVDDAIYAKDTDGINILINEPGARLVGMRAENILGKADADLFSRESARQVRECDLEIMKSRRTLEVEETLTARDGSRVFRTRKSPLCDKHGNVVGVVGVSRDVTDRKSAEDAIHQLDLAVKNAMTGVSRLDTRGIYLEVRERYAADVGYRPEELIGKSWQLTVHPDDLPLAVSAYELMLEQGPAEVEIRAIRKDGSEFEKRVLLVRSDDVDGEFDGHYCFMCNISLQRSVDERLRQTQRADAVDAMVRGIIHDFNNLVFTIQGYTEITLTRAKPDSETASHMREILSSVARSREVVGQLRSFARRPGRGLDRLSFRRSVEDALEVFQAGLSAALEIRTRWDEDGDVVHADAGPIQQIVINLCTNAAQAMEGQEGGVIDVSVTRVFPGEEFFRAHPDLRRGPLVRLAVADSGCGISEENRSRIFDPFFTTRPVGGGSGSGTLCGRWPCAP